MDHMLLVSAVDALIIGGHLRCIECLHSLGYNVIMSHVAELAGVHGQLEVLIFYLNLRSPVIDTRNICYLAARHKKVDCFVYACEQGLLSARDREALMIESQHVEIVKYLHERGEPFDTYACCTAAGAGNLELLKYLHEQGCAWMPNAITNAARGGHLQCLQYLHEHGCPWDEKVFITAAQYCQPDCLKYLLDNGGRCNGRGGGSYARQVSVLLFLHEYGFPMHYSLCARALLYGQLACLVYLHEHGVQWRHATTDDAARKGHRACMVYAHQHGCPWGRHTCSDAASYGNLDCLQYAYEHGAPWDLSVYNDSGVYRNPKCCAYIAEQLAKLQL